ncbi:MAG: hypothetical protein ABSE72_07505, partial [Bacteroidales bacterium]
MSFPEIMGLVTGLLQFIVAGYALRLNRIFGTARVGWSLFWAFSLLALLHRRAREAGAKTMKWFAFGGGEMEEIVSALHRAGYVSRSTQGVWMMHIRRLDGFLGEIAPAIEKRLAESEFKTWEGTIDLIGRRLKGR